MSGNLLFIFDLFSYARQLNIYTSTKVKRYLIYFIYISCFGRLMQRLQTTGMVDERRRSGRQASLHLKDRLLARCPRRNRFATLDLEDHLSLTSANRRLNEQRLLARRHIKWPNCHRHVRWNWSHDHLRWIIRTFCNCKRVH